MTAGKKTSSFERDEHDWYVEQDWTVDLLLSAIRFTGSVLDPACGMGTIPLACQRAGIKDVTGTDLIDRGYGCGGQDFLRWSRKLVQPADNIITNPPFKHTEAFIEQGLKFCRDKAAFIVPLKFLSSNSRFFLFNELPIWRVCILSSRPSMPPGQFIDPVTRLFNCDDPNPKLDKKSGELKPRWLKGEKPGGGAIDYCWIVFKHGYTGTPGTIWLRRKDAKCRPYNHARGHKVAPEAAQGRKGADHG